MPNRTVRASATALPKASRRLFLAAGSAAAVCATLKSAAAHEPDAMLIRLGAELAAATENETRVLNSSAKDVDYYAAHDRTSAVVTRIIATKATTIRGLKVKAKAILWCHSDDVIDATSFSDDPTTDIRVVTSIVQDLLAVAS